MDPVSITSGCVGLLTGVAHLTGQISSFVSAVRDARKDMVAVSRELISLSLCLETLRDDSMKIKYPEAFHENLLTVLKNCDTVTTEMTTLLSKLSSANLMRKIQWSAMGKDDMNKLRSSLESHKSALEIGLDMTSLLIISAVKSEVAEVKADTVQIPSIKQDTSQIEGLVQQIGLLRLQLENIHMNDAKARHLQMFLDQSTTYAETVMDSIHEEADKPYATDGSESDESENEQQVSTTIPSTKPMMTQKISSSPEQPNHTLSVGTLHLSSTALDRTDGVGLGPPDMRYDVTVPNSMPQALAKPLPPLGHNANDPKAIHNDGDNSVYSDYASWLPSATQHSQSETSDQPLPVRDYATQSTMNTSAFSENGTTELATDNLESSRASRQPAKAHDPHSLTPVAHSSNNRLLLPTRDREAIQKATLLRNAMTQKEKDRLHASLEVAIRGKRGLTDRLRSRRPWLSDERGSYDTIKNLLDRGADPNRLSYGYDLFTIEIEQFGRRYDVLNLLLLRGASLQPSAVGRWLVRAVTFAKYDSQGARHPFVKALLDCGVSPNAKNAGGTSALSRACRWSDPETVKLLLDGGAIADDSALIAAVQAGRIKIVDMLLGQQNTSISTAGKESAAKFAFNQNKWAIVDAFLKHDASLVINTPDVQKAIAADRKKYPWAYERRSS